MAQDLLKIDAVLRKYAANIKDDFIDLLKQNNLGNSNLSKTFKITVNWTGKDYSIIIKIADYYKFIESGRKAGAKMPPLKIIIKWIGVRKIIPRKMNGITPTVKQLAFLIGRKIARDGIRPKPMLGAAILLNERQFQQDMEVALLGDIEDIIRKEYYNE